MLEELCRALSTISPPPLEAIQLWEQLISGPLTQLLQDPSSHAPLCSQSCSVLATIGSNIIASIKVTLSLTCVFVSLLGTLRSLNIS